MIKVVRLFGLNRAFYFSVTSLYTSAGVLHAPPINATPPVLSNRF